MMSSPPSLWSRTMSTMTRATSDNSTSAPHTPSSSSVVTGLKAALGSGSFFHAHLQEGQRFDDSAPARVRYKVATYAIGSNGIVSSGMDARKSDKTNVREESPRVSPRHSTEKPATGPFAIASLSTPASNSLLAPTALSHSSTKKWTRSASATAMSSDNQEFWAMVSGAKAAAANDASSSGPRRYHYITRSQSAGAAAEAGHLELAPKMHKKNASYSPGFGTPAYHDSVENPQVASDAPMAWCPTRGRFLSPIEEVQFFPENKGDSASLHSATSTQSNLFIHRSVRRTPSASTFNSAHSGVARSPEDATSPQGTSPSRGYGQPRPFPAPLPVIPASPRESQNVFESEPASLEDVALAYPMPVVYPSHHVEYSAFGPPGKQDLAAPLPSPRFAAPPYPPDFDTVEEQDLGEMLAARQSMPHSRTPSLLTRSESVRTELTYLTAQDSAAASRRASAVSPGDLEAGTRQRSPLADGDTTLVDTPVKGTSPSPAARLKASLDTLLTKSPRMRKSPGGAGLDHTTVDAESTFTLSSKAAKVLLLMQDSVKKHTPWSEGRGKPAEVLFWTGFVAPWCWLIGGWMLARSGETMMEGLPSGAKEPDLPPQNVSSLNLQGSRAMPSAPNGFAEREKYPNNSEAGPSVWQAAKNSSVELLDSLRGRTRAGRTREDLPSTVRAVQLHGDVPVSIMVSTRLDPWVSRCRVAAVVSGMFILALCIVALVVLVRSI